jgi:hypothetical protein
MIKKPTTRAIQFAELTPNYRVVATSLYFGVNIMSCNVSYV